jgi:hypothetical protein
MRIDNIALLKAEVEYTFGRKIITSKDCNDLTEAILRKTGNRINYNTLRRLFGLIKAAQPSLSTLNILAAYCGFASIDELATYRMSSDVRCENETFELLQYFILVFKNIPAQHFNDPSFIYLTKTIIESLNQKQYIADNFQHAIANTCNGKRFYFELFFNIDKLNAYYGDGLRYYLAENKTSNAQIFGNSLLCMRHWLTMDYKKMEGYYQKMTNFGITLNSQPFFAARYFAASVFFAEDDYLATEKVLADARAFYTGLRSSREHETDFPYFELIFSEALVLTNNHEEALFYITRGIKGNALNASQSYLESELVKGFKLYQAIALANLGRETKALELFEQIEPHDFYFVSKKFHTMLYLMLGARLNKIRSYKEQLEFLINETGFKRLTTNTVFAASKALQHGVV